jgi:hypothetical protein
MYREERVRTELFRSLGWGNSRSSTREIFVRIIVEHVSSYAMLLPDTSIAIFVGKNTKYRAPE